MADIHHCAALIRQASPEYPIHTIHELQHDGQFSDVLIVNGTYIFRFPRQRDTAHAMWTEIALLQWLQGRLPLAIPNPIYNAVVEADQRAVFMGYDRLGGVPLSEADLNALTDQGKQHMAEQLCQFLIALHELAPQVIPPDLTLRWYETRDYWAAMYTAFYDELFPYLRDDARQAIYANFASYFSSSRLHQFQPTLRHGDFGAGNILWNPDTGDITGILDFTLAGIGDPAQDIAALLTISDDFLERALPLYPEIPGMLERAGFYASTYALQEALHALRDGDEATFTAALEPYV